MLKIMREYVHIIDAVLMQGNKSKEKTSKLERLGEKGISLTAEQKEMKIIYESGVFLFPQIPDYF